MFLIYNYNVFATHCERHTSLPTVQKQPVLSARRDTPAPNKVPSHLVAVRTSFMMQDLRCSQRYCWVFRSPWIWHWYVTGCFPPCLQCRHDSSRAWHRGRSFETSVTTHQATQVTSQKTWILTSTAVSTANFVIRFVSNSYVDSHYSVA